MTRAQLQYKINEFARKIGLDVDQVSALIFDTGVQFAHRYYMHGMASVAVKTDLYWSWYLTAWHRVDEIMEETMPTSLFTGDAWGIYQFHHLPGHLLQGEKFRYHPWPDVNRAVSKSFINQ